MALLKNGKAERGLAKAWNSTEKIWRAKEKQGNYQHCNGMATLGKDMSRLAKAWKNSEKI